MGTTKAVKTRQLNLTDDRWNQLFGLPEGTKTKRKTIKMTPRLQKIADDMNHLVDKDGNKVPVTRENIDDVLACESRNGEILVGHVGIDSAYGQKSRA